MGHMGGCGLGIACWVADVYKANIAFKTNSLMAFSVALCQFNISQTNVSVFTIKYLLVSWFIILAVLIFHQSLKKKVNAALGFEELEHVQISC